MTCKHEKFHTNASVRGAMEDGKRVLMCVDVQVTCSQCSEVMRFVGFPALALDALTVRLPIRPTSEASGFAIYPPEDIAQEQLSSEPVASGEPV